MKRFFLTIFFAVYHMFMPFVLLNCSSSDLPYALEANADETVDPDAQLAECQARQFLTEDCVSVIQAADESESGAEEAVVTAYDGLPDFIQCEKTSAAAEGEEADPDAPDCEQVVSDVLGGYDTCLATDEAEKGYVCDEIEGTVSEASEMCAAGDASVTADFCSILG